MKRLTLSLAVFAALLLMLAPDAAAGKTAKRGSSCAKCCKVVCGTKLVKKTVWVVECEQFCVANPTLGCGKYGKPSCGKLRSRKQLIKKEIAVEVPVYRCVPVKCSCPSK